eukprot:scaffold53217_cov71-Phaeocystis_antarctica.AAC.2
MALSLLLWKCRAAQSRRECPEEAQQLGSGWTFDPAVLLQLGKVMLEAMPPLPAHLPGAAAATAVAAVAVAVAEAEAAAVPQEPPPCTPAATARCLHEVLERAALTNTSRACSRSALALTSTPAPSSVGDHASTRAFASMNSHFSASSKRAKRTGPSLSASLPIARMCAARQLLQFSASMGEQQNWQGQRV